MEANKDFFKIGDRVFHIQYGWGNVIDLYSEMILVKFEGRQYGFPRENNKSLSFTEYTLQGFSQERPEELPKPGDIVWVRDREYDNWMITYFRKIGGGDLKYGTNPRNSCDSRDIYYYAYLTTIDPYTNEKINN